MSYLYSVMFTCVCAATARTKSCATLRLNANCDSLALSVRTCRSESFLEAIDSDVSVAAAYSQYNQIRHSDSSYTETEIVNS